MGYHSDMARNILPSNEARENEILGLVYWNIPFVKAITGLSFAIGLLHLILGTIDGVRAVFSDQPIHSSIWQILQGSGFLGIGGFAYRIFRFEKKYVESEDEDSLIRALSHLCDFWILYGVTVLALFVPIIGNSLGSFGSSDPILISQIIWGSLGIYLSRRLLLKPPSHSPSSHRLTSEIPAFAKTNLSLTCFTGFFSIGIGALYVVLYVLELLPPSSLGPAAALVYGLAFITVGSFTTFLWRAVREIHRNPSLIYFERMFERLNLFWLATTVAFFAVLVATVFG